MDDNQNKPILKYIWHTNSPNSCEACRENAGKEYFSANDIPPLPVHPNCHCWVEPIYAKENNECNELSEELKSTQISQNISKDMKAKNIEQIEKIQKQIAEIKGHEDAVYRQEIAEEVSGEIAAECVIGGLVGIAGRIGASTGCKAAVKGAGLLKNIGKGIIKGVGDAEREIRERVKPLEDDLKIVQNLANMRQKEINDLEQKMTSIKNKMSKLNCPI